MFFQDFIKKFNALNNKKVDVQIKHKLYGNQKLNKCVLHPFMDGERIGFIMDDGEEKYITIKELREFNINENEYYIKSDVMEFNIVL